MSSARPSTNRRPSSSRWPRSPVDMWPSRVSSFSPLVYSSSSISLPTKISPLSPGGCSLPSSSKILSDVPGGGLPLVPGAARMSSGSAMAAQATSVERAPARGDDPQRRQVVLATRLVVELEDPLEHYGDDRQRRDRVLFDRGE